MFRSNFDDSKPTTPQRMTPQRMTPTRPTNFKKVTDDEFFAYNPEKEPIKAYLRIRPCATQLYNPTQPYLEIIDDSEISMTPPEDSNAYRTRNRTPERYKFTKIFTESTTQSDFFNQTTLPLIHDVLKGENALIFAYGVTNSGKTYSIMGTRQQPGLLPRALDVIFNSLGDHQTESQLKPCMHSLVQTYSDPQDENRQDLHPVDSWGLRDRTVLAIDRDYEYGIWVSFAEIYTERIYDLLVPPRLSRKSLSLKYEYTSGHKYISGLKEVRIRSIEEAYGVLLEGQKNRAEYSTITNHTSSRSHSIFTIRVVRVPIDEEDYVIEDPVYATVSKMSIVDLAGSERYRNTLNSGQRLKEAGNINKSLMVLGQCMETLRMNQMKIAMGKKASMVPYRHSKLTELFKSSFEGDGKAVMVVNVNPFDTGFDENSHVMKFAAVAKDVATWRRIHPKLELKDASSSANKRLRTKSKGKKNYVGIDSLMEEDDNTSDKEEEEEDDDEDTEDPFVDNLIAQLDDLKNKWIEAETRCTTMESDIRQQVTKETDTHLRKMEEIWMKQFKEQVGLNGSDINEKLADSPNLDEELLKIRDKQNALYSSMESLTSYFDERKSTEHNLLEKITELEKEKQRHQEIIRNLTDQITDRDHQMEKLKEEQVTSDHMVIDSTLPTASVHEKSTENKHNQTEQNDHYEKFLDLRKRLRRSIFRGDEYSHDADVILSEIEQFKNVTFELVKETNMGKLMKLISQKTFQNDPYNIHSRSVALFKKYAKLSVSVLAPKKTGRGSMVVLSVSAGREEELINEMRGALASLSDENLRLKQKLKFMQEGHRRLKEAFDKTQKADSTNIIKEADKSDHMNHQSKEVPIDTEIDVEMYSPILGTSALDESTQLDHLNEEDSPSIDMKDVVEPSTSTQLEDKNTESKSFEMEEIAKVNVDLSLEESNKEGAISPDMKELIIENEDSQSKNNEDSEEDLLLLQLPAKPKRKRKLRQ